MPLCVIGSRIEEFPLLMILRRNSVKETSDGKMYIKWGNFGQDSELLGALITLMTDYKYVITGVFNPTHSYDNYDKIFRQSLYGEYDYGFESNDWGYIIKKNSDDCVQLDLDDTKLLSKVAEELGIDSYAVSSLCEYGWIEWSWYIKHPEVQKFIDYCLYSVNVDLDVNMVMEKYPNHDYKVRLVKLK